MAGSFGYEIHKTLSDKQNSVVQHQVVPLTTNIQAARAVEDGPLITTLLFAMIAIVLSSIVIWIIVKAFTAIRKSVKNTVKRTIEDA